MDDDFQLQSYQDDLDTDPNIVDEFTHAETDDLYIMTERPDDDEEHHNLG